MRQIDDLDSEVVARSCNFIVFEPASLRVQPIDVLLRGEEVINFYYDLLPKIGRAHV